MGTESNLRRVTNVMRGNRSTGTKPEMAVRRLLHARGYRYRVNFRPMPSLARTADLVFTRKQIAVFIDGCFWHGCPQHYVPSKTNQAYWLTKIEANIARDRQTTAALQRAGWLVLRFWTHSPAQQVVEEIERQYRLR